MCLAMPGQVIAVDELAATVQTLDRKTRASTMLVPDIAVGEWVFVAAGAIVERLDPDEAAQTRELLLEAVRLEATEAEMLTDNRAG